MRDYGIQRVMKIRLKDTSTSELKAELRKLNETTFTNGEEVSWLTNGEGTYVTGFSHTLNTSISGANTRISGDLMSLQVGSEVEELTNSTLYEQREVLTIDSNSASTTYVATGTADAEIGFAYLLDSDGNKSNVVLTQASTASTTEFSYDNGTKVITTSGLDDGAQILVLYYPTASTLEKITNSTTKFSATCDIVADAELRRVCDGAIAYGQIVGRAKISGDFEWSLSEGGSPAMHNFKVDFVERCGTDQLWDLLVVDGGSSVLS